MGVPIFHDVNSKIQANNNKNMTSKNCGKEFNKQQFHETPQTNTSSKPTDLVGNNKEFRMNQNTGDLRIIGNGNCIRIAHNTGNLQVIGNSTRLKIKVNNGHIKYTGNDGRVCLGSESSQQTVDYIGCNGRLKLWTATQLTENKAKMEEPAARVNLDSMPGKTESKTKVCWQQFSERFQRKPTKISTANATSLPNIHIANSCCEKIPTRNINTIIVQNSVNVSL